MGNLYERAQDLTLGNFDSHISRKILSGPSTFYLLEELQAVEIGGQIFQIYLSGQWFDLLRNSATQEVCPQKAKIKVCPSGMLP